MNKMLIRAREIIDAEAHALHNIPLDDHFVKAVSIIYKCSGKVITTGIGKAGNIATKIAGTLSSTGTPACFVHPAESAHGDLGVMSNKDVILAFSTSGKTREVLEMLERARHMGVKSIIGVTSHPDSTIRKLSDVVINMGDITEPCTLGLTPTSSTTVMIALGDALALILMEKRGFTRLQYGLRHHGGYLGQKARE